MEANAIAIFTGKSTAMVLEDGGSRSWVLDQKKARGCEYAVLYFNEQSEYPTKGFTGHREAFLVGRISNVVPSRWVPGRYLIQFDAYAEVSNSGAWAGWRNPVRYTTLEELGIDETKLKFVPMPEVKHEKPESSTDVEGDLSPLTIHAAKVRLALQYDVKPEQIEIVIRA
ncbi:hypothetical protein [Mesorhizobium sp.]|uniref:hypothetical protein n=1 Tax=Mesorhizobium sp. TaxID=1871066 RepID=UPI000FE92194|nr:hypothetical protein [Mesorhizobium sp.]RWA68670.1 MAG: hypothetical protein EOQ29_19690 [Mesorhizobium sp.]